MTENTTDIHPASSARPDIPGVGPSVSNDTEITDEEDEDEEGTGSRARDVWVFLRPLDIKEPPLSGEWPNDENQPMSQFPKSEYAGCKLCSS